MFLECKQCGGEVPFNETGSVALCPYCGSQNTIGKAATEQGGLVNRANYLRRNNEFDKAAAIYEELLKSDNSDYEAHWGLVLCKYGIEYVEDPASGEQKPTCHRTFPDSVLADTAYQAALKYAPLAVREVYERDASEIDLIQKNIIALSKSEEQYDVFLCYKELDEASERTPDSVIAQELEFELSRRGYRVFFARKTLERVLGSEYEPVIYAALQSARAMVVLGTKPEHFNAVWVRNEWSRYRELIRRGEKKILVPAYRGMSPYDLPLELSNLQALDMSKLGFVQDLCDGIDRFTRSEKRAQEPAAPAAANASANVETLLKRAFLFLEEGSFQKAEDYIERILDQCPEEPRAYLGKLMIECGAKKEEDLANAEWRIDRSSNYGNAKKFGDDLLAERLGGYATATEERALSSEWKAKEQADENERFLRQINQEVKACSNRISSGTAAIWLGSLLLTVGLILWAVTLKRADGFDELGQAMFSVILYCLPGATFLSVGVTRRILRTSFGKYSGLIQHDVEIRTLAQAAGLDETVMAKTLDNLINKGYLQHAHQQGGKLLFQLGAPVAGIHTTSQTNISAAQDKSGYAPRQIFKGDSQQFGDRPNQHTTAIAARKIQDCLSRMPSGKGLLTFGGIIFSIGLLFAVGGFVTILLNRYFSGGSIATLIFVTMLAPLPGQIFIYVGRSRKRLKAFLTKARAELYHGANIAQAARAAQIPESGLEKALMYAIDHGYLEYASVQNGVLTFRC